MGGGAAHPEVRRGARIGGECSANSAALPHGPQGARGNVLSSVLGQAASFPSSDTVKTLPAACTLSSTSICLSAHYFVAGTKYTGDCELL